MNKIAKIVGAPAIAAFLLCAPLSVLADGLDVGGFDYIDTYTPSAPSGYDYIDTYTPSGSNGYDYIDTFTPSYGYNGGYGGGFGSGYSAGGYMAGGYSAGGYFAGGGILAGGFPTGNSSVYAPTNTWDNGNTTIYAPTNTCTAGNSCNTDDHSIFNAPTTIVTNNPAPVAQPVVYSAPTPVCGTYGYNACPTYAYNQNPYNPNPYITLSQVPYTGLDLGFWGTIAYWGFLILLSFIAAYLLVIVRVQNRIARSLKSFLFGTASAETVPHVSPLALTQNDLAVITNQLASMLGVAKKTEYQNGAAQVTNDDATDEFITSQIQRPLRK